MKKNNDNNSNNKITLDVECQDCKGTGLYEGFMERRNYPVICHSCSGTGCIKLVLVRFTERKKLHGVKGVLIRSSVGYDQTISYEDFLKGKYKV